MENNVIDKSIAIAENLSEDVIKTAMSTLSGTAGKISDKLHSILDTLQEFKNYKPKDPFEEEDKKMGLLPEETPSEETAPSKTKKLKEKFMQGVKNIIPGLDIDTILDKLASKCKPLQAAMGPIKDSIYHIKENKRLSPEEKATRIQSLREQRQKQIDDWKKSQKDYVSHIIDDIKADFDEIKFGVENLTATVPIVSSQLALPTFIGTGSPNPARVAADFLAAKRMLMSMVHPLQTAARKFLDNCDRIDFDIPEPVLDILEGIASLEYLISKLPG